MTPQRSVFDPLPGPSKRRPSGAPAKLRHFICYHDPDVMGYEVDEAEDWHVVTSKKIRDLEGDLVWLIGRYSNRRSYYIFSRFRVSRVQAGRDDFHIFGDEGVVFAPPIAITRKGWFLRYKDGMRGLSHGFQHVLDERVLTGLRTALADWKKHH